MADILRNNYCLRLVVMLLETCLLDIVTSRDQPTMFREPTSRDLKIVLNRPWAFI